MRLDSYLKTAIITGVLLISFSIFYYFVIFIPQKEETESKQKRQEQLLQEKQFQQQQLEVQNRQALLENCLEQVNGKYADIFQNLIEACNVSSDAYNCGISVDEKINREIKEAKNECFKKSQ